MSRAVLIGSNGQLGSDIVRQWAQSPLGRRGDDLIGLTHADVDVTDEVQVTSVLLGAQPELVINTAAYHRVDECEDHASKAFQVNALGVKYLAEACRKVGATLVHFSTDYVFDGGASTPYSESHPTHPLSAYGISKVAGESFLRYLLPESHLLVRSSGLYGISGASGKGGNFVETMRRLARGDKPIRVVSDQMSAPTSTADLAEVLLETIARGGRGTFHITNQGQCSWYEFAQAIFELDGISASAEPITSAEYGARARRPAYSVLENANLRQIGLEQPRPWRAALAEYLRIKGRQPV